MGSARENCMLQASLGFFSGDAPVRRKRDSTGQTIKPACHVIATGKPLQRTLGWGSL